MKARHGVLALVRVVGLVALVFVVYAWFHPAVLDKWTGRRSGAIAAVPQNKPLSGPTRGPLSEPMSTPIDKTAEIPPRAAPARVATPKAVPEVDAAPETYKVTASQAAVARWIGTKYGVAPGAIAPLVAEADTLTKTYHLSPNLLIAVMAIESNFHPYIQSEAGAQGLMQVMPKIHSKRYEKFGGKKAFLDPSVSLHVGADILRDAIKLRGGSEAEGLRFYFGGGPASGTYIDKVRIEQARLNAVAHGAHVPPD
jgi:soluble lytic murein transglycosylase-like protein